MKVSYKIRLKPRRLANHYYWLGFLSQKLIMRILECWSSEKHYGHIKMFQIIHAIILPDVILKLRLILETWYVEMSFATTVRQGIN